MSDFLAGQAVIPGKRLLKLGCSLLLCLWQANAMAAWYQQHQDLMGTRVSVELWHSQSGVAEACSEQVFAEMRRIEALMSSYRPDSELSRINNNAATSTVTTTAEMGKLISRSLHFSRISNGAFDITYASLGHAYDFRERKRPSESQVAMKLPAIDYRHIDLNGNNIHFKNSGVRINLGGIAKGYAVDRAAEIINSCGISQAMVSAGGDSRIIGDRGGRPWIIGIQHPRDPDNLALRLPLSDTAVSTSGDYERFFFDNGERVHHIINPSTGYSAKSSWSATVTGPDAMTTDALSTTLFIMGASAGLALIESLDGIDAIIIDHKGKLHYSSGFVPPEIEG